MKKYIYNLIVLCGLSTACTETTKIGPEEYTAPAKIEVSSTKVIFDADGGSVAVIVATNTDGWEYQAAGSWFTVTQKDGNTLEITAPANGTPGLLTGSVTVSGKKGDQTVTALVNLTQRAERSTDLSAAGTANCYIVHTNQAYKFRATVKGNGNTEGDGRSTYLQLHGIDITDIAYADLLWETRNDGDRTMSREIIDGSPVYRDGYVAFSTGRSQGNAVIAVRDITGNVLWSWHIWVCDDEITTHYHLNTPDNIIAEVMDRNLGAINNNPMDVDNRGMSYQWGRKDPFPPARSPYVDGSNDELSNNETNAEVGNGSGTWQFHVIAPPLVSVPGNIPYSIQNPMAFLVPYYNDVYEWYCMSTDGTVTDSGLWSDKKTIFDPCPAGYKIPGKDMWGIPAGNQKITTGGKAEEYDENGENPAYDWNVFKDGGRRWKYTGDYYPAAGTVAITENTPHHNTGTYGFYWTTQKYADGGRWYRVDFTPYWAEYFSASPVFSAQIRCIKE